jgi:hypothetical protein
MTYGSRASVIYHIAFGNILHLASISKPQDISPRGRGPASDGISQLVAILRDRR